MSEKRKHIEKHPLQPFLPEGARILMLGSFPPPKERWSMEFFYPNWINDMWRILGYIFFDNKDHFAAKAPEGTTVKRFDKDRCAGFAEAKGIAMYDAAEEVRRLKDNASDKFLEVVTPSDLISILRKIPECQAIATTGQKASEIIAETLECAEPHIGGCTGCMIDGREIRFWRMPSSSRAYPLALEKKAEYYKRMFEKENML